MSRHCPHISTALSLFPTVRKLESPKKSTCGKDFAIDNRIMTLPSPSTASLPSKLSSKCVLVIGGSTGIGRAVALLALHSGALVTISSSSPDNLSAAKASLLGSLPLSIPTTNLRTHACDLSDPATLEQRLLELFETFGTQKVNHIVFTAGPKLKVIPVADATPEYIWELSNVRIIAPVMVAKLAKDYLEISSESSITFTGGSLSDKPAGRFAVIAGIGTAIEGLTRGIAVDMKPVRVNVVSPGPVETELWDDMDRERLETFREVVKQNALTGTVGRPEDIAEAYLYLMRDWGITGEIIRSHGGRLLT